MSGAARMLAGVAAERVLGCAAQKDSVRFNGSKGQQIGGSHGGVPESTLPAGEGLLMYFFDGSQGNGLYVALSYDGRTYRNLMAKEFAPKVGDWEIFRDPAAALCADGVVRLVWTTGKSGFGLAESRDYLRFERERFVPLDTQALGDSFKNTWAPEIVYRADTRDYVVIFAATLSRATGLDAGGWNHRHYYVSTTDFVSFSQVQPIQNGDYTQIDGTVTKFGEDYYLFFKDEREGQKAVRMSRSSSVTGPYGDTTELLTAPNTEGPALAWVNGALRLYFDFYSDGGIRQYIETQDLKVWSSPGVVSNADGKMRHGSLLHVNQEVLSSLAVTLGKPLSAL